MRLDEIPAHKRTDVIPVKVESTD